MKKLLLITALATIAGLVHAQAIDLSFSLDKTVLTGKPGDVLELYGTINNKADSSGTVFLDGLTINANPDPSLFGTTISTDPFFFNAPLSLDPGQSWDGIIAEITLGQAEQIGNIYYADANLTGGLGTDVNTLGDPSFQIKVGAPAATPEPVTTMLAGIGVFTAFRRRRSGV